MLRIWDEGVLQAPPSAVGAGFGVDEAYAISAAVLRAS